jgi:hypothetical protein
MKRKNNCQETRTIHFTHTNELPSTQGRENDAMTDFSLDSHQAVELSNFYHRIKRSSCTIRVKPGVWIFFSPSVSFEDFIFSLVF